MGIDSETRAVFLHADAMEAYAYPDPNPFKTERAGMARRILSSMGLISARDIVAPEPATRAEIERFHTARYLDAMIAAEQGKHDLDCLAMGLGTEECPVFRGMYDYAALATGASLRGADLVASGEARIAFNPSGGYHHAGPELAAGFCYINDVVLACQRLADRFDRVLFLDIDVHHGDGVQGAFYDRSDVCTLSIHETGRCLFPHTGFVEEIGAGTGRGYSINLPLPPNTTDQVYLRAFDRGALPLIRAYDPQAIVLELGMDALAGDPMAHLKLTNNAYADVLGAVIGLGVPILATGGGGYHAENTARGWALLWSIMTGREEDHLDGISLGGAMLASTDWSRGLRDSVLAPDAAESAEAAREADRVVEAVRTTLFPIHGI